MPNSLMDMFGGGFTPYDVGGRPAPNLGFGDQLASRSNSLIGLGLGLLSGTAQDPYGNALRGYTAGSAADRSSYQNAQEAAERRAARAQAQSRQAREDAYRREIDARNFGLREREFERSDPANAPTEFTKAARDLNLTPGTPEHTELGKKWYSTKSEGNLAAQFEQRRTIAKAQGLDENDPKVKNWIVSGGALNEEGKPLPAEMSSRIALGGKFLDEAPAIRSKIESGIATDTATGKIKTYFNVGEQGEIARKVKSGTDALLRSLTGAGMPDAEARKYVARYEIQPTDGKDTALSKFDQLQDELTRAEQEAYRGRGGIPRDVIDRRKAVHESATKATAPGPTAPKAGHVEDGHVFKGGDPSDPKNWAPVR